MNHCIKLLSDRLVTGVVLLQHLEGCSAVFLLDSILNHYRAFGQTGMVMVMVEEFD